MQTGPIIRAMLRNKSGYILIALQIAVTMAIMINAIAIIQERSALMARASGVDEDNLMYLSSVPFKPELDEQALIREDLDALRNLPGVVNAISTNSVPLRGGGWSMGLQTEPGAEIEGSGVAIYFTDEHGIDTFGVSLVAGRNFLPEEVQWNDPEVSEWPTSGIVTAAMVETLFPEMSPADAVGRTVYINDDNPVQIVGVMAALQAPWSGWSGLERSMLVPQKRADGGTRYVIRTEPGQQERMLPVIEEMLASRSQDRIILNVRTMKETRRLSYLDDSAMVRILTFVVTMLTTITGLGIVGLASFSVSRRTKQIGTRRALGATRSSILGYFMLENFLVSSAGVFLGAIIAIALNVWMAGAFDMAPMSGYLIPVAMLALWLVGQLAVAGPARRAAAVSPAVATRTI